MLEKVWKVGLYYFYWQKKFGKLDFVIFDGGKVWKIDFAIFYG